MNSILNKDDLLTIRCIVDIFSQNKKGKVNAKFREHLQQLEDKLELLHKLAPSNTKNPNGKSES